MRTLITGHKGLLGQALLSSVPDTVKPYVATRDQLDLRNENEVSNFLQENSIESVILSAARVGGIIANSSSKHTFLLENLKIQNSVISACLTNGISNLIFIGSSCVYPVVATPPFREEDLGKGAFEETNEGYAIAKFAGIKLCQMIAKEKQLSYSCLMPPNLYGPGDNFDLQRAHVIPALIKRLSLARSENWPEIEIMGNGMARREFLFSEDLASAIWFFHGMNLNGEILNVGTGFEITIRNLATLLADILGYTGRIKFLNNGLNGVSSKLMNSQRANALGWRPMVDLREGLSRTVDWYNNSKIELAK